MDIRKDGRAFIRQPLTVNSVTSMMTYLFFLTVCEAWGHFLTAEEVTVNSKFGHHCYFVHYQNTQ